jgi:hypothetical protein
MSLYQMNQNQIQELLKTLDGPVANQVADFLKDHEKVKRPRGRPLSKAKKNTPKTEEKMKEDVDFDVDKESIRECIRELVNKGASAVDAEPLLIQRLRALKQLLQTLMAVRYQALGVQAACNITNSAESINIEIPCSAEN